MIELTSTVGLIEQSEKKAVLVNRYWCDKLKRLFYGTGNDVRSNVRSKVKIVCNINLYLFPF